MSLKLVIFDVDGLLLDTERVWQDVWYDTARDFGIDDWKREDFLTVQKMMAVCMLVDMISTRQHFLEWQNFLEERESI